MYNSYDPKYKSLDDIGGLLKIQKATVIFKTVSFLVAEDLRSIYIYGELTFHLSDVSAAYSILRNSGTREKWADENHILLMVVEVTW